MNLSEIKKSYSLTLGQAPWCHWLTPLYSIKYRAKSMFLQFYHQFRLVTWDRRTCLTVSLVCPWMAPLTVERSIIEPSSCSGSTSNFVASDPSSSQICPWNRLIFLWTTLHRSFRTSRRRFGRSAPNFSWQKYWGTQIRSYSRFPGRCAASSRKSFHQKLSWSWNYAYAHPLAPTHNSRTPDFSTHNSLACRPGTRILTVHFPAWKFHNLGLPRTGSGRRHIHDWDSTRTTRGHRAPHSTTDTGSSTGLSARHAGNWSQSPSIAKAVFY